MNEVWKDVKDYEGAYQVSNLGRIRSLDRAAYYRGGRVKNIKGKIISSKVQDGRYPQVALFKEGILKGFRVHRLVADVFICNPENKTQVNHINGIKSDNRVENLEWNTPLENNTHAILNGLKSFDKMGRKGQENKRTNLTDLEAMEIYKLAIDKVMTQEKIADKYKVTRSVVNSIKRKDNWKHIHGK